MAFLNNLEQGAGGLVGKAIGGISSGLMNFGAGIYNGLTSKTPTDAPIPSGIANFKMGSQAATPESKVTPPSNSLPAGTAKPAAPLQSPQSAPATAAPSGPGISAPGVVADNSSTDASTQSALSSAAAQSPGGNQYTAPTAPQIQNGGLWGGVVSNLANTQPSTGATQAQTNLNTQATGANPAAQNINTLTGIGLYGSPQVQQAMKNEQGIVNQQGSIASGNALAAVDSGRAANVQTSVNSAAQLLANAQAQQTNQINAANAAGGQQLTGQAQQIGAANNAGNLANTAQQNVLTGQATAQGATQPVANAPYFGSPATGGVVGQGQGVIGQAISNALQQVSNNGNSADIRANLVSSYGSVAGTQFDTALLNQSNGTYNPTAQSASADQTASQAAQTGGEAFNLSTALKQVSTIQPVISNFLATSGINPTDSKLYNTPINNYISTLGNPAATQQYNTMLNDLQNFSSQIVSSGTALTPTGITAATELQDPSGLSMNQINYYMNTLASLGQNRLSVLQSQAQSSGYTGYSGAPASPVSSTPVSPGSASPGGGVTGSFNQGVAGATIGASQWAVNSAQNLGGEILGFVAKGAME